jgi:glycosyltransferase involved in cell wall biosynthesis
MIMTIHDLNHLVLPQFYTPLHQLYYRVFVKSCIARSTYILTVSQFSKKEIIRTLGLDTEKVFVTYNGVSQAYKPVTDQNELAYVREIYELPEELFLCVSNNKPHKNVHQLVRAYCQAKIETPLVLATPVDRALLRLADSFGKKHLIYFSKFIAEDHLPAVYSLTRLFVYPSTYEGFGLPPLEALCCGAPVVVARSSSLPEVVGDNAIFANPYDHLDIAKALERGIKNPITSHESSETIAEHRAKFSWDRMTEQTLALYRSCLGVGPRPASHDALANPDTPEQVKKIVSLYKQTLDELGLTQEYLGAGGLADIDATRSQKKAFTRKKPFINKFTGVVPPNVVVPPTPPG